jgi:GxxExxY protein
LFELFFLQYLRDFLYLPFNMQAMLQRENLLYRELSYEIVGCAFEVFRELGPGHPEKVYQRAMATVFRERKIKFTEQYPLFVNFKSEPIANRFADFLVEEKIIVELKRGRFSFQNELEQTKGYLEMSGLQLGIIIRFTQNGAQFRRVVNLPGYQKSA